MRRTPKLALALAVSGAFSLWTAALAAESTDPSATKSSTESTAETATTSHPAKDRAPTDDPQTAEKVAEEITVWGEGRQETHYVSPNSLLIPADLAPITAVTTEDLVKYEPSVIIRRRYIGDPNGTIGMRGSNMFQTARTMVFADGIPLHYFLQTRFNGSPRWGLVNADEIGFVEVVYGPFSAEYGGNAMGGVVNIETTIPTNRRIHLEGSLFNQTFDEQGFDDSMDGFKGFVSYGEKLGKLSVYAAASLLENDSQPLDYRFGLSGAPSGDEIAVTGSLPWTNEYGDPTQTYANTGPLDSRTGQFKLKLGYELPSGWFALFNMGYEARDVTRDSVQNDLRDSSGLPVWSGDVVQDGIAFNVRGRNFTVSDQDRRTLLLGGRVQGQLRNDWHLEASFSVFDILEDESRASLLNPADPAFTAAGTVRDFDEAGWETAEVKFQNDELGGNANLGLVTGYRYEHYALEVTNYNSDDFAAGPQTSLNNASGGESMLHAAFAQFGWQLGTQWDVAFGGRFESWESQDGFFNNRGNLDNQIDRSESRFSPKVSVGYRPNDDWQLRLSSARAFRFPIVEELFQNERRTNGTSIANANLEPEDGLHHNLMIERLLPSGHVRVNLFTETIDDVIFNQTSIVDNRSVTTFLPIDEVVTDGADLIYNQSGLLNGKLSVRFNTTYLDAEITENSANRALEGNVFPRLPEWRAHLLVNVRVTDRWDVGGGIRYSGDSFGDLDNSDTATQVFGAHDAYTQINLKTSFQLNDAVRLDFG
ncbi:MAG: TonB-dependent receptor, partial [Acidobacteriota bacterium]